jgi:hypothetical protein
MASTKLVKKSANQWLKEIANEVGCKSDVVPEEWITIRQMTEQLDMSLGEVDALVQRAMKAKKLKKKKFRIDTQGAGVRAVWHYTKI